MACHASILPFIDLTLLACNAATAIIANVFLSTMILEEKLVWRYDLPALTLIAAGSILIAFNAHTEQVDFTPAQIYELLLCPRTVIYTIFCLVMLICEGSVFTCFLAKVRQFERDAEAYEQKELNDVGD